MKKAPFFIALILIIASLFCFAGCGKDAEGTEKSSKGTDDSAVSFHGVKFTLPEGFSETEISGIKTYIPEDYPSYSDNFNIIYTAGSEGPDAYSEELIKTSVTSALGIEDLNDFSFTKTKINGKDMIVIKYGVSVFGIDMGIEQLVIFPGSGTVTITFTSTTGKYDKAFETVKSGITVG